MKRRMILIGLSFMFLNNQTLAKPSQHIKENGLKKTKACFSMKIAQKKSKGFARAYGIIKEQESKLQNYQNRANEIISNSALSDNEKQEQIKELTLEAQEQQKKAQSLIDKLNRVLEDYTKQFQKSKIVNYKKIVRIEGWVLYNEDYLKENYDDLTEEYIKGLDKALKSFGVN